MHSKMYRNKGYMHICITAICALLIIGILIVGNAAFAATVQVSWLPNTEPDLAGYKVYYGEDPGIYGDPVTVGIVESALIDINPTVGQDYYFAVTAFDFSGNESSLSAEVSCFMPDSMPPSTPTILEVILQTIAKWFKALYGLRVTVIS